MSLHIINIPKDNTLYLTGKPIGSVKIRGLPQATQSGGRKRGHWPRQNLTSGTLPSSKRWVVFELGNMAEREHSRPRRTPDLLSPWAVRKGTGKAHHQGFERKPGDPARCETSRQNRVGARGATG